MSASDLALVHATAVRGGATLAPPERAMPARIVAIGDPQASAARWFGALAAHGLLGDDGWLRPEVALVAMGDYFDYPGDDAREAGISILGWLAAHAPEHVAIVFGNHEAARVMELATVTDARFREAAAAAMPIVTLAREHRAAAEAEFARVFPEVATPGYAARDYSSFTVEQRDLVKQLLVAGRFTLAATAALANEPVLITHAAVTERELALLGLADRHPQTIADALNTRFRAAIAAVAPAWRAGTLAALSLEPLHVAGAGGEEGGGLLYHRPSDPERSGADPAWEHAARGPRRYDPRTLPRGLVQVIGHTGHKKACQELARWVAPGDADGKRGGLRTLRVTAGGDVSYRRGIHPAAANEAVVYMTDPEMHYVDTPADVAILDLV